MTSTCRVISSFGFTLKKVWKLSLELIFLFCKVLDAMGSVFKFVSSDVDDKSKFHLIDFNFIYDSVKILQKIEKVQNFITIEKMMTEEKAAGKINYERLDEKDPSASRTLLRLHRAFKMISTLLGKISRNEHEGKMSTIAYESYHSSPMPAHHPWVSFQFWSTITYFFRLSVNLSASLFTLFQTVKLSVKR